MFIIFYSCKKADFAAPQSATAESFTQNFFATKTTPNNIVADVIEKLKAENERTGFVNKLPKNCGLPVWDKIVVQKYANDTKPLYSPAKHGPSANFETTEDSSENIIIPLTINDNNLSAIIIVEYNEDGTIINCYLTNSFLYNTTHGAAVDITIAMQNLALFFYMENRTFGTTTFYHIPANLFSHSTTLDTNGDKTITIKDDTTTTILARIVWICIEYECPQCHGADPNCPLGGHWTVCTPVGGGGGGGGNTGGGNGGGGPGGGGNGGGGSGGGGGGNPCPFTGGAWYNFVPPEGGCEDPPPPPNPPDTTLNPCADAISLQNSASFINYMQESKDSTNSNREYGYLMFKDATGVFGNTTHGLIAGPENHLSLGDFTNSFLLDCIAHSHFDTNTDSTNGLSIFGPDDLWTMCRQFNLGNVNDPSTFSMALTTKKGTQYLIKIKNLTKFRLGAINFTQGDFKIFKKLYGDFYGIKKTNNNPDNEKKFLQYLKTNFDSGLTIFRGNSTFTNWDEIGLDNNNNVITIPCN